MPKIPTYERQANLPGSTNPYLENPEAKGKVGRALQGVGEDMLKRSLEKKTEQDELDALETSQVLADEVRAYEMREKENKGKSAEGATVRTGQYIDQRVDNHAGNLSRDAAKIFREKAMAIRAGSMDTIASFEAREHQLRRDRALQVIMDTWKQTAVGGEQDKAALSEAIKQMKVTANRVYSGYDKEFRDSIIDSAEDEMTKTWLVERIKTHPALMLKELDQYKDVIPAGEFEQVKNYLKQKVQDELARSKFLEIKGTHGSDYDGMLKEAGKIKNDTLREAVTHEIKADYATSKTINDDMKREKQNNVLKSVVKLWGEKDYKKAREIITDNIQLLEPSQSEHWLNSIDLMTESKIQGIEDKNNPFSITDQSKYSVVSEWVATKPKLISSEDIWKLHGKGLSTKACEILDARLQKNKKKRDPRLERAYGIIKAWVKDGELGDNHAENANRATQLYQRLEQFLIDYPEKDPVDDFLIPESKQIKKNRLDKAFKEFREGFVTKTPSGAEKHTYPVKRKEKAPEIEFNEDSFVKDWLGSDRTKTPKPIQPEIPEEEKEEKKKELKQGKLKDALRKSGKAGLETVPVIGGFLSRILGED